MIKPIYCELSKKLEDYIVKRNLSGRLPGLSLLSTKFGVHQATMSKAVKLLEKKGLLTINGTRGTFINECSGLRPAYKVIGVVGLNHIKKRDNFIAKLGMAIKKSGYTPIGITISEGSFTKNPELLSHFPVDGFLFCCSSLTGDMAKHLHRENIPFVVCNRRPDIDWINTLDFDHEAICSDVLKYLKGLGHHRIAYISPASSREYQHHSKWINTIIRNVLRDEFDNKLFYDFPLKWQELSQKGKLGREINRMLHYFASLPEPPTAIIVPGEIGMELVRQLKNYGLSCPRDISVFFYGTTGRYEEDIAYSFFDYEKLWIDGIMQVLSIFRKTVKQPVSKLLEMPVVPGGTVGKAPAVNKVQAVWDYGNIDLPREFKKASGKRQKVGVEHISV
jgi:DNA-binding LacI/PurR family transcriptional regulator